MEQENAEQNNRWKAFDPSEVDVSILTGKTSSLYQRMQKLKRTHKPIINDSQVSSNAVRKRRLFKNWNVADQDEQGYALLHNLIDNIESPIAWKNLIDNVVRCGKYDQSEVNQWYERAVKYIPCENHRKNEVYIDICLAWALSIRVEGEEEVRVRFRWIIGNRIGQNTAKFYLSKCKFELECGQFTKAKNALREGLKNKAAPNEMLEEMWTNIAPEETLPTRSIDNDTAYSQDTFRFQGTVNDSLVIPQYEKLTKANLEDGNSKQRMGQKLQPPSREFSLSVAKQSDKKSTIKNCSTPSTRPVKHECVQTSSTPHLNISPPERKFHKENSSSSSGAILPAMDSPLLLVNANGEQMDLIRSTHQKFVVKGKNYYKLMSVGKGGSGKVYKVIGEDFNIYALKKVCFDSSQPAAVESLRNEINLLIRMKNKPNIIQMFDWEADFKGGLILMLFEYGEIDLSKVLKKNSENPMSINYIRTLWQQMLEAVLTIHNERIVHSDLKPANFLLVSGDIKLIDFGIAKAISNDTVHIERESQIGTVNYMAPESLTNSYQPENSKGGVYKLGRASDIWSLGCILYQMVYGKTPFHHIHRVHLKVFAITDEKFPIPFPDYPDSNVVEVLRQCLQRDPSKRPTISQLLSSPFLNPHGSSGDDLPQVEVLIRKMQIAGLIDRRVNQKSLSKEIMRQLKSETAQKDFDVNKLLE